MASKPTLYEILGLPAQAGPGELEAAYRQALQALEDRRGEFGPAELAERQQVLRVAYGTLRSPSLRADYDAQLAAAARAASAPPATGAVPTPEAARAEALGLRADALALRAEAILARAQADGGGRSEPPLASWLISGANRMVRAIGLLVVVGALAFGLTRLIAGDPQAARLAAEARTLEQIRLQEYAQTHGVRPASIAQLEQLEAERRGREAQAQEARQAEQERRRREDEQRRWEEDARRVSAAVSSDVRRAQEEARRVAERTRDFKVREEQLQLELHFATTEADRQRLESRLRQLRERYGQP